MDSFLTIVKIFFILASIQLLYRIVKGMIKKKHPNMPQMDDLQEEYDENHYQPTNLPTEELKTTLGVQIEEVKPLVEQLNAAWNVDYSSAVRNRLINKNQLTEEEYDWYELELKRFFFLTVFIKQVPMYSEKVDAIWHDMILFTKDYAKFCDDFIGEMIHHIPNVSGGQRTYEEIEHERALFELMYSIVFSMHDKTEKIHGRFFNKKLSNGFIEQIKRLDETELEQFLDKELFRTKHPNATPIITAVTDVLKGKLGYLFFQIDNNSKNLETYTKSYSEFSKKNSREYDSDDNINLILFNSIIDTYSEPERSVHISGTDHSYSHHSSYSPSKSSHHSHDSNSSCSSSSCSSSSCSSSSCSSCGGGCSS